MLINIQGPMRSFDGLIEQFVNNVGRNEAQTASRGHLQ